MAIIYTICPSLVYALQNLVLLESARSGASLLNAECCFGINNSYSICYSHHTQSSKRTTLRMRALRDGVVNMTREMLQCCTSACRWQRRGLMKIWLNKRSAWWDLDPVFLQNMITILPGYDVNGVLIKQAGLFLVMMCMQTLPSRWMFPQCVI